MEKVFKIGKWMLIGTASLALLVGGGLKLYGLITDKGEAAKPWPQGGIPIPAEYWTEFKEANKVIAEAEKSVVFKEPLVRQIATIALRQAGIPETAFPNYRIDRECNCIVPVPPSPAQLPKPEEKK